LVFTPIADADVVIGPRIGVDYAGAWAAAPLRFHVRGNPHVSHRPAAVWRSSAFAV
jgi:DNA-3-methyladenine glycosylase